MKLGRYKTYKFQKTMNLNHPGKWHVFLREDVSACNFAHVNPTRFEWSDARSVLKTDICSRCYNRFYKKENSYKGIGAK